MGITAKGQEGNFRDHGNCVCVLTGEIVTSSTSSFVNTRRTVELRWLVRLVSCIPTGLTLKGKKKSVCALQERKVVTSRRALRELIS